MIIVHLVLILLFFYWMTVITGRFFIASLDNISDGLGLPPDVAGATLMAAGTSAPELATTLIALLVLTSESGPDFGMGTIIGSAIFQILVVIGFASLMKTTYLHWQPVVRDGLVYAAAVLFLLLAVVDGELSRLDTAALLSLYGIYLLIMVWWKRYYPSHWDEFDPLEEVEEEFRPARRYRRRKWLFWKRRDRDRLIHKVQHWLELPFAWIPDCDRKPKWTLPVFVFSLLAIAGLTYGLVELAVIVAAELHLPTVVIALTILAGGSSLPELVSSAIVAKEGRSDMAISNAIGSNTYAVLVAMGLPFFLVTWITGQNIQVGHASITSSIFLLFVTLVVVLGILAWRKWKVTPKFGSFLIFLYVCYVVAAYGGWL